MERYGKKRDTGNTEHVVILMWHSLSDLLVHEYDYIESLASQCRQCGHQKNKYRYHHKPFQSHLWISIVPRMCHCGHVWWHTCAASCSPIYKLLRPSHGDPTVELWWKNTNLSYLRTTSSNNTSTNHNLANISNTAAFRIITTACYSAVSTTARQSRRHAMESSTNRTEQEIQKQLEIRREIERLQAQLTPFPDSANDVIGSPKRKQSSETLLAPATPSPSK